MLMGYEIFGQNYWFPSTPLPGIINDHSLNKEETILTAGELVKNLYLWAIRN